MNFRKLTPEETISKERIALLSKYPFFGYLALGLQIVITEDLNPKTMATDGRHLFVHPEFIKNTPPEEIRGVIAHEVLHCALLHLWRLGNRNITKWNYATDYAINAIIKEEELQLPYYVLFDKKYKGMTAERIYDLLPEPQAIEGQNLVDSHEKWPNKGSQENKSLPQNHEDDRTNESRPGKPDKEMENQWKERLVRAAHEAKQRGKLPGQMKDLIDDILEPKLDWKVILRDQVVSNVKNDFRFYPPSKRNAWQGLYLPSTHGERLEIACAIDSSGSVSEKQFQEFLAELRGITEQFEDYLLHLFICDTSIRDDEYIVIDPQSNWPKSFPKRNGGTSFIPVFEEISKKNLEISTLIYLTDGQGAFPDQEPEYPVIWILNAEYRVPWGMKVIMDSTD